MASKSASGGQARQSGRTPPGPGLCRYKYAHQSKRDLIVDRAAKARGPRERLLLAACVCVCVGGGD